MNLLQVPLKPLNYVRVLGTLLLIHHIMCKIIEILSVQNFIIPHEERAIFSFPLSLTLICGYTLKIENDYAFRIGFEFSVTQITLNCLLMMDLKIYFKRDGALVNM